MLGLGSDRGVVHQGMGGVDMGHPLTHSLPDNMEMRRTNRNKYVVSDLLLILLQSTFFSTCFAFVLNFIDMFM